MLLLSWPTRTSLSMPMKSASHGELTGNLLGARREALTRKLTLVLLPVHLSELDVALEDLLPGRREKRVADRTAGRDDRRQLVKIAGDDELDGVRGRRRERIHDPLVSRQREGFRTHVWQTFGRL